MWFLAKWSVGRHPDRHIGLSVAYALEEISLKVSLAYTVQPAITV